MIRELTWISPLKAALVAAVLTFIVVAVFGLIGLIFGSLLSLGGGAGGGPAAAIGVGPVILSWLFAPLMVFIFTFIYCVLFNLVVNLVGGIPVRLIDKP